MLYFDFHLSVPAGLENQKSISTKGSREADNS